MKHILFILTIFLFGCSDSTPEKKPQQEEVKKVQNIEPIQDFGLEGSEPSYDVSIDLESTPPRYWYVSFSARRKSDDAEWKGYRVIKMEESYFDVYKAVKMVYPTYVDEDYVGIDFFKEVSEKTYVEFMNTEIK